MYTLITAANSSQAYKLKNSLDPAFVLLGDYLELPELLIQSGKAVRLPHPDDASYIHKMLALCIDNNIHTVYALREKEKELLLNAGGLFDEYHINLI